MLVIGLTGSIGSGKSTVANLFARHGVPVVDADVISRTVTQTGMPAFNQIVARFGQQIVNADGTLDRSALREIIFSKPEEKRWLEALLHPLILERMHSDIQQLQAPYCLAVIPLLLESEAVQFIQRILVVDIPEATQIERAAMRDKSTKEKIKNIINTQVGRDFRLSKADDVIDNTGSEEALAKQVDKLHQMYLKLARK